MTLPKIYEDAINCFCSRTAWEMRRLVEKYLLNGERPYINKRMGETPAAVLRLIFNNINQTAQLNRAIKLRNQVEEEIKLLRDGKNIDSLSPGPSITDTNKGEKNIDPQKEKKEEKNPPPPPPRVHEGNFRSPLEEKNGLSTKPAEEDHGHNFEEPEDPDILGELLKKKQTFKKLRASKKQIKEAHELISYYNEKVKGTKLPPVLAPYPALIEESIQAISILGVEKAHKVILDALETPFITGDNKFGFLGNFNWIFGNQHYYKILNNEYEEHERINFERNKQFESYKRFLAREMEQTKTEHLDDSLW